MLKIIKYLNSINLTKLKRYANMSGSLLVIILALDLHRYGAWFTGDATFLYPYALPVLLVLGAPVIVYAAAAAVQKAVSSKRYTLLYLVSLYICCLPFGLWNPVTIERIFKDDKWYNPGILRPVDAAFITGILASLITAAGIVLVLWLLGMVYRSASRISFIQKISKYL